MKTIFVMIASGLVLAASTSQARLVLSCADQYKRSKKIEIPVEELKFMIVTGSRSLGESASVYSLSAIVRGDDGLKEIDAEAILDAKEKRIGGVGDLHCRIKVLPNASGGNVD